ncbi:phosphohydrolase [Longispora fulva]|uniref:PPOX class probable FMN-dependent enzyme n=1 Tax=Longispora fulva TaxID=619741 RepID=A0A8J7GD99_9ACTN|nr:pyridoxamine 5'-phosphate oxidase family protein [Longispora fulva]MBG6138423.1 PPOX class probable FMN-dependent enzyme [Longispora fulva]GIG63271.1 phosphohydrolase [Longispora fulva]
MGEKLSEITTEAELRALLGEPQPSAVGKERVTLQDTHRAWLAAATFCLVGTSDAAGNCDVSPKGDPPGFALVLDERTLAIPERPGNRRADGFLNILANPHVGLLFLVPGRSDTLRVNGRARLVSDAPFFDRMVVRGHRPALAMIVDIEQIFFHCPKAFLRGRLWRSEEWAEREAPTSAEIAKAIHRQDQSMAELEEYYGPAYAERIYDPS